MMTPEAFLSAAVYIALAVLLLSMVIVLWRLTLGPRAADRVVAMDLLSVLVLAFLVAYAIYARERTYLDVAIAFACIAFLGTIALARFLLRAYDRAWCENRMECIDE
jgi:multicomponent Na+:H+ antiporter subunit F